MKQRTSGLLNQNEQNILRDAVVTNANLFNFSGLGLNIRGNNGKQN